MSPELLFEYCFMAVAGTGLGIILFVALLGLIVGMCDVEHGPTEPRNPAI